MDTTRMTEEALEEAIKSKGEALKNFSWKLRVLDNLRCRLEGSKGLSYSYNVPHMSLSGENDPLMTLGKPIDRRRIDDSPIARFKGLSHGGVSQDETFALGTIEDIRKLIIS